MIPLHRLFRGPQRGANAMEFALVAQIVLVPLVLLTLEMSWYLAVRIGVEHCVRDGVRAGSDICDPDNCSLATGGECGFCLNAAGLLPENVAEDRFEACWADTGYPGTATGTATLVSGATSGHSKLRLRGSVTYSSLAASTLLPNPVVVEATYRVDDQSFEP